MDEQRIQQLIESHLKHLLENRLTFSVKSGSFCDPNNRELEVFLDDVKLPYYCTFDVVQKNEYGG